MSPADATPATLGGGRYVVEAPLGRGGFAAVYRVRDTALGVARAVKVLTVEARERRALRRRLRAEARAMARLAHPNVLRVYDIASDGDVEFIVMELAEGGTLEDRVEKHGPMSTERAVAYVLQILAALAAAHGASIIHRDVKPSNVLLDARDRVMLADFGIALLDGDLSMRGTRTGVAMGTMAYMAPEQRIDARSVGPAADLYAVGASLFFLVTGASPVDLFAAAEGSRRWNDVPTALRPILARACAYEPERRHGSARELARELRDLLPADLALTDPNPSESMAPLPTKEAVEAAVTFLDAPDPPVSPRGTWIASFEALSDSSEDEGPIQPAGTGPRGWPRLDVRVAAAATVACLAVAAMWWGPGSDRAALPPVPVEGGRSAAPVEAAAVSRPAVVSPPAASEAPGAPGGVNPAPPKPEARSERAPAVTAPAARPEPAEPPPAPLGRWIGSLAGRTCELELAGSPDALTGTVTVRFGENVVSSEVAGRFDPSTGLLELDDVADREDAGRYVATLDSGTARFEGQFQARHRAHRAPLVWRRP